jgi:hypothetical protein
MLWERCKTIYSQPGKFQTALFIELRFLFGTSRVVNRFWVSNRVTDYKSYVRNNYLITSFYIVRYLHYIPFLGDVQRSNSHKWHPIRQLNDDVSAIFGSLKTTRVFFQPSRRCSIDLCNKNRAGLIFLLATYNMGRGSQLQVVHKTTFLKTLLFLI